MLFRSPIDDLISPATMRSLTTHHWPGNVRELRNMIEATLAMGEPPAFDSVAVADPGDPFAPLLTQSYRVARQQIVDQFEARYLKALLERAGGNISKAARDAQMNRSYLQEMLQRHRLK